MKTGNYGRIMGLVLGGLLLTPAAFAETFAGKINGHGCAHEGKVCPVDRLDPHIALERDFVLHTPGGEYLFMSNLPRSVKVRHVLSDVEVSGTLNPRYHSIEVDELRVKSGGEVKTVWSKKQQQAEYENFYSEGQVPIFN